MSEGRIERLSVDEAKEAAAAVGLPEYMAELSIFQVLLRHPRLALRVNDLLAQILFKGSLDGRLRELVIMRIGWATGSVYEWVQHWRVGPSFGASPDDLVAVRDWRSHDGFGPAERAVLAATDDVLRDGRVSPATWEECEATLGSEQALIELVVAIGGWHMISQILESLEVPLEDGLEPWPPDGVAPTEVAL